ncbi:hypothetical protein B9Z55_023269 [Caenorhabditis nigoni]|uniref:Uncharacterized protein n=1 Tax=Caenorhabditis nigoni TaxID=1611254 RepID=A0A2G5SPM9_9PELO|nr:hypothetical protein B9Z55_023269 [Caenorhabditis nigoni]
MAIDTTAEKLSILIGVRLSPQALQRRSLVGLPQSIHFITDHTNNFNDNPLQLLASHGAQLEKDSSKMVR